MSVLNLHSRMHTIPDVDQGRIPNNPGVLGHYTPEDKTATLPWYFGGANQRAYFSPQERPYIGDKGSFMSYGKYKPGKRVYDAYDVHVSGKDTSRGGGNKGDWAWNTKKNPYSPKGSGAMFTKKGMRHNKNQLFG